MATKITITPELDEAKLRQQLNNIQNKKEKITVDINPENINNADTSMKRLNNTVANSNTAFGRLKSAISNTFSTGKVALTGYLAVLNEIRKAARDAKKAVEEISEATMNLQVSSGLARGQVQRLIKDYNAYGKSLGATTTQITDAADDYLRSGKTLKEASELIKSSTMLSKLGKLDSAEATNDILAVMNGYDMSIEGVNRALDTMVKLDMSAAVSSGEVATAMQYVAANANAAGISFDKLASMIAVTRDRTRLSAESIGTAFNTIISRYKDITIGEYLDSDGEEIGNTEKVLRSLGVELRDENKEFRAFETVLDEVAKSWDSYSSVQQAAISKQLAGTRQQNKFIALVSNYNKVLELTEASADSAGLAVEKFNDAYLNSLEAKRNQLQNSFESLVINTNFEEVYSDILGTTTGLIDLINQTNALKGALTGLTVAGGIKGFLAIKTGIYEAYIAMNKFQNALNIVKNTNISTKEYERLLLLSNGLSRNQMKLVLSTNSLTLAQKKELLMASGLSEQEAILQLQTWKMATANTGLTASTTSLGNAFKSLWSTLIANPIVAVTALVTGATMAWQSYKQHLEEIRQTTEESANSYKESASAINDYASRYQELHKALLEAKGNEEETYNIKKQLLDLQTELNDKFGDEYDKINLVTDAYRDQAEAIKALNKETAQAFLNENKAGIDKASKEMTKDRHYNLSYTGMSAYTDDGAALKEIAEKYEENGISILEDIDGTFSIHLNADAQSAYDTINSFETDLRDKAKELGDEHMFDNVLDISSGSLNKAKETIEQYSDIYKQALTAEITADDSKSAAYGEALQAVEAYNEAVLNSENSYDDQKVSQAKEKLDTIKGSIRENEEELGKYAALFDDVFDQADTRVLEFNEAIRNDSGLQGFAKDLEGLSNLDLQALDKNAGENTSFDKLKEAAGEYQLNVEELINTLIRLGYIQGEIKNTIEDTAQSITPTITSSIQQIATQLEPQFAKLGEAYKAIFQIDEESGKENFSLEDVDNSMLEDLRKSFAEIEEEIGVAFDASTLEPFFDTLTDSASTADQVHQAFNDLATAYFYSTETLEQLNEETAESIVKQLEEMGVVNAQEVVYDELNAKTEALALQKRILAETGIDVMNASSDVVSGLLNEAGASEVARNYLFNLIAQEQIFSNSALDTGSKVAQLQELATAYGQTAVAARIAAMQEMYANNHMPVDNANILAAAQTEISNAISNVKIDFKGVGSGKKSGGSKSKKEEKDTTKEYDWIEQAIENVEKEIKELDEVADSSYSTLSRKNEALTAQIGKVTEEIELQQKAYEEYMQKADSIGLPDSYKELVQNGAVNIEDIKDEKLQEQIDGYQKWYDKAQNASDAIKELKTDLKDLHVESYKLQTENLKDRLDSDSITEKQYLAGLKSAYEQFYGNLEEYAQQYHEAKLEYLEEEKKYLNSVANAAASLLDVEIDRIQENADEQEEQLKGQIELLEARKKPLQDELEALDDKVRKEGLALNLQKAQYDLARAENQRSKLIYTADKGMIYTNDTKAIRDAEKDVDDAKLEIHKQSIQDQIDVLDDEISRYDELIDQINKAADAQVKALEKIKNKWQEVIDQQEYAKNVTILTGEFGSDAIVKILSGNDDDLLAQWKNSYINTLKSIDSESQGYIGEMTKQIESLYKNQASAVTNVVSNVNNTVDKSVNTIKGEITLPDGTTIYPIQPGDRAWELQKAFEPLVNKILNGETDIVNSALFEHQRQMEQWTKNLTYSNVMNNVTNNKNMQPVINIGDITVQGVQDVNGFARAVKAYFPNTMLQEMHKR